MGGEHGPVTFTAHLHRLWRHGWRKKHLLGLGAITLLLQGCAAMSHGFLLGQAGPVAQQEHREFIEVAIVLIFVFLPVFILVPLISWHYRISNAKAAFRPQWGFSWWLEGLIWIPPTGIVILLSFLLWPYTARLDPYRPLPGSGPALQVQVVALDWKWLFIYPAQNIATVNQLVIPAGQPVHFMLTSGTVMQSLLIPRLAGQIYAMNHMQTQLNFAAAKPGTYLGENTQFNGTGFQQDKFQIIAVPPANFPAWVARTQGNSATLDPSVYQTLSRQSVLPQPMAFGKVTPNLYAQILAQKIPPGYIGQQQESGQK